ncbi:hypothetical protein F5Y13DRAFT_180766 [Hypoxylon sp. FL1857]|nr:hypothetical protein F5Y13DRAFT_180766 [Hypoxylon sp. FL1857]
MAPSSKPSYPLYGATEENHTMGTQIGEARRSPPSITSNRESKHKPFNWQRPTARFINNRLLIECFPGHNHVQHYAEIIATYLMHKKSEGIITTLPSKVSFIPCSPSDTWDALWQTNLRELPREVTTVVLGRVHRLEKLTGPIEWPGDSRECFQWTVRQFNNRKVAFIGFRPSFWGDIAGGIVHFLSAVCKVHEVLYFGKLATVRKWVRPNTWLATGGKSIMRGKAVEWENVLRHSVAPLVGSYVLKGNHITVGNILHETNDWLAMFGYLHVISDNVAEKYDDPLNEWIQSAFAQRKLKIYEVVQNVFWDHLSSGR